MYVALDVSGNPLSDTPTWTEVTEWVCHEPMQISRGRQRGSNDFQPASGSFSLICEEGRFDPSDATGAYYPNFGLRTRVYIAATLGLDAYDLAVGYITSVNVRWNHRGEQIADVTWVDLLGILASYELPESNWDDLISKRTGKLAWHKLGTDTTNTVRDYSGNEAHGKYVTYEDATSYYDGPRTPEAVVKAGVSDPIAPQIGRPSQSWGKMTAEAGTGLNAYANANAGTWRATAVVCNQSTALCMEPGQDWSVEMWVTLRPAFAVTFSGESINRQIDTGLIQWGDTLNQVFSGIGSAVVSGAGPMFRLGFAGDDAPGIYSDAIGTGRLTYYPATGIDRLAFGPLPAAVQADPLAPVYVAFIKSGNDLKFVVNVSSTTQSIASIPPARGFPLVIAPGTGRGWVAELNRCGFWGSIGDVVVYNRALTFQEHVDSRNIGTSGDAFSTSLIYAVATFAGDDLFINATDIGNNAKIVRTGPIARRTALEYMRLGSASDAGPLYVDKSGTLVAGAADWPLALTEATTVQWTLTDDDTAGANIIGHNGGALTYDDANVVNDCTVSYVGGTVQAVDATSIARHGRMRRSIDTALVDPKVAKQRAEFEVWRHANPLPDIGSVAVEPVSDDDWTAALGLDLLHRVRVILTRPDGSQLDQEYWVERMSHSIDMGQGAWRTTLGLMPADSPAAPFIIGTSLLDGDDVLWY